MRTNLLLYAHFLSVQENDYRIVLIDFANELIERYLRGIFYNDLELVNLNNMDKLSLSANEKDLSEYVRSVMSEVIKIPDGVLRALNVVEFHRFLEAIIFKGRLGGIMFVLSQYSTNDTILTLTMNIQSPGELCNFLES